LATHILIYLQNFITYSPYLLLYTLLVDNLIYTFSIHKLNWHIKKKKFLLKIWKSISDNYELIEGAQLSNSFIILIILDKAEDSLTSS
jgi:hypothetical protein